ncbi:MAG: DNA repair protein RecN [Bacteroidota bacterium]
MIQSLQIKNYALIEGLDIHFPDGLTIITGETGAGKSIILGALGLIMGDRADTKALYDPTTKCVIEGRFQVGNYGLSSFFEENDLDYEEELIIRREITPSGKSRAFVNDTPANLKILQRLSAVLIDLHQQFDTLDIHQMGFQLRLLDALAENGNRLSRYQTEFRVYTKNRLELERLQQQNATANQELDFKRFQLAELEEAMLLPDEQTALEREFASLSHAEDTKRTTAEAYQFLCENEQAIIEQLQTLTQSLQSAAKVDPKVEELQQRLLGITEELNDIGNALERHAESTDFDPERIQELQARLDQLYRLQKKHQVASNAELLEIQEQLRYEVNQYENIDGEIARLTEAVQEAEMQLREQAAAISKHRQSVAPGFAQRVAAVLADLAMPSAVLKVDFQPLSQLSITGSDEVQFLFSANRGSAPKPIKNVASGGELSRLTLVTKSLVASAMALPTLIFDEIDSGVSGDVALKMGHILRDLSSHHQIVVITHSPQVAARADEHLFVYKKDNDDRTQTKVRVLQKEERIRAIATMLSQNPPSDSALENARELIGA